MSCSMIAGGASYSRLSVPAASAGVVGEASRRQISEPVSPRPKHLPESASIRTTSAPTVVSTGVGLRTILVVRSMVIARSV